MRKRREANQEVREAAKTAQVFFWEIANVLGKDPSNFSATMRRELPREEKDKILAIIDELAREEALKWT